MHVEKQIVSWSYCSKSSFSSFAKLRLGKLPTCPTSTSTPIPSVAPIGQFTASLGFCGRCDIIRAFYVSHHVLRFTTTYGGKCVKLHEYQSKRLFAAHGVPIPRGEVATTPEEARRIAEELGGGSSSRPRCWSAGAARPAASSLAHTPAEAEKIAARSWAWTSRGCPSARCWWKRRPTSARRSTWASSSTARARRAVMMASAEGGVEIEQVAHDQPRRDHQGGHRPLPGAARLPDAWRWPRGSGCPGEHHARL